MLLESDRRKESFEILEIDNYENTNDDDDVEGSSLYQPEIKFTKKIKKKKKKKKKLQMLVVEEVIQGNDPEQRLVQIPLLSNNNQLTHEIGERNLKQVAAQDISSESASGQKMLLKRIEGRKYSTFGLDRI